ISWDTYKNGMKSTSLDKKYDKIPTKKIEEINFSIIIIPFHQFGKMRNPSYIYDGSETIAFKKRHPLYQVIFRNEFVEKKL
ncbi:MAG: hypothetical protein ACFFG0_46455, partial [Candidatus Thorarchaeota archaeon]